MTGWSGTMRPTCTSSHGDTTSTQPSDPRRLVGERRLRRRSARSRGLHQGVDAPAPAPRASPARTAASPRPAPAPARTAPDRRRASRAALTAQHDGRASRSRPPAPRAPPATRARRSACAGTAPATRGSAPPAGPGPRWRRPPRCVANAVGTTACRHPSARRPVRPVGLLGVEEEALVERPHLLERLTAQQQHRPDDEVRPVRSRPSPTASSHVRAGDGNGHPTRARATVAVHLRGPDARQGAVGGERPLQFAHVLGRDDGVRVDAAARRRRARAGRRAHGSRRPRSRRCARGRGTARRGPSQTCADLRISEELSTTVTGRSAQRHERPGAPGPANRRRPPPPRAAGCPTTAPGPRERPHLGAASAPARTSRRSAPRPRPSRTCAPVPGPRRSATRAGRRRAPTSRSACAQRGGVTGRHEHPRAADHVRQGARVARHHGHPARHGLDGHAPELLDPRRRGQRRHGEHVERPVERRAGPRSPRDPRNSTRPSSPRARTPARSSPSDGPLPARRRYRRSSPVTASRSTSTPLCACESPGVAHRDRRPARRRRAPGRRRRA